MALNSSGPISFGGATAGQSINLELGVSATALASINSTAFRTLAGVPSGAISLNNFYGKSNLIPRGIFAGGYAPATNVIQYTAFATTGNTTDFGDLAVNTRNGGSGSSSTRAIFSQGYTTTTTSVISYVTFATTGNATFFGNASNSRESCGGFSSSTRTVIGGGYQQIALLQYITTATTGNTTTFGDLYQGRSVGQSGASNGTRGMFAGGFQNVNTQGSDVIDYVTIATTGNATLFGNLRTGVTDAMGGLASSTRAVWGGFYAGNPQIQYVTMATTGNSLFFGNLTVGRQGTVGSASDTRGLFAGGNEYSTSWVNIIDYITIASTGNATDFGDLINTGQTLFGCSNCSASVS